MHNLDISFHSNQRGTLQESVLKVLNKLMNSQGTNLFAVKRFSLT